MHGWTVTRLGPACGARLEGASLTAGVSAVEATSLAALLAEHGVLALPGQDLTPAELVSVGRTLGTPYIHPFLDSVDGYPEVLSVIKEATDGETFGGEFWHADITYEQPPSSISLVQARELAPLGGDTLFANQHIALDTLSPGLRSTLERLEAVHCYPGMAETDPHAMAVHPVIRTHPISGRSALFVNAAFTTRFLSMSERESRSLLQFLFEHQTRPEIVTRIGWQPGQLTLWDNRVVQHYAMNDYPGHRRELHRVTVMEP